MPERWGISGDNWGNVRPIPMGEEVAHGWCVSISTTGCHREPMNLYRDTGDGWQAVKHFPLERGTDQ